MPRYSSSVDGAELFYRDYAPEGRPPVLATGLPQAARSLTLVLLHQWPLSSRMYDPILLPLCETHGYRVIAPDRRGFGKSEWAGHDSTATIGYKELGQDLSGLLERIQPGPFVLVATSMSTGEALLAYLNSSYIQENCQSPQNPKAPPQSVWDSTLMAIRQDRPNFIANGFRGPFGVGTSGSVTEKQIAFFENIFFENDPIALERCLRIYTCEDLSEQIKRFGQIFQKPFLLIHGGGDGGVPAEVSAELVQKSVPGAKLTIYEEGGHVLVLNYADRLLDDIVNFVEKVAGRN
ncbi:Alpha/Beta hydrolase protein [Fusarium oxysporum Fo47]|uniref:Alpha/Beta hydrolase protein n=1 Tax=Fusarium oxysporum Fo47 TaxID=660027 RepID=UPI002869A3DE|nr:Alpha/Beta hydrolase protein [Fusarium oxysporum Fo47]QKD57402.2 Alpha/Beta hydrolase protein [Fusarium oxysporum Fo47]